MGDVSSTALSANNVIRNASQQTSDTGAIYSFAGFVSGYVNYDLRISGNRIENVGGLMRDGSGNYYQRGQSQGVYLDDQVSSPGESHPEALSELYVNLSTHTAPIKEPLYPSASEQTALESRKLERDRDRSFADFDRPIQMSRFLQVPVGLPF